MRRALTIALLTVAALLSAAAESRASHYGLEHAQFVTRAERLALARVGILDTQVLLQWIATPSGRDWVGRETGLDAARLETLATQVDLLRVPGYGPNMVDPLQKAGIRVAADLARAEPGALLAELRRVTRGTPMAHRMPAPTTLKAWVHDAKRLRPVLRGIR